VLRRQSGAGLGVIRVWTQNLLYEVPDVQPTIRLILETAPDFVLLQEVTPESAHRLEASLADSYPFRIIEPATDANGFGILSRHPLEQTGHAELSTGPRFLQMATAWLGEQPIYLANLHLVSPVDTVAIGQLGASGVLQLREQQAWAVAKMLRSLPGPAIAAGDLNASPGQSPPAALDCVATDVWPICGHGVGTTWPMRLPRLHWPALPIARLDYCFVTGNLTPVRSWVEHGRTQSDHAPLVADLEGNR
jgi:endonuclease/exonuclease/phosphatase (EEP) superfamily protein YafD